MKVKYCFQCGAELEGTGEFCTSCGAKITENSPVVKTVPNSEKQVKKKEKTGQYTLLTVILTLFLGIFAWFAATLYSSMTIVEEENLSNFVGNVEWTDIEMETITDGENKYDTLGEIALSYVYYYAGYYKYAVTEKAFEKLTKEEFFTDYVVEVVMRYIDAIKEKEYKKGCFEFEELYDFLDDNEKKIDKIFDDGITNHFQNFLDWYLLTNEDGVEETEEALCLKTYKKKLGWGLDLISFFLNPYLTYIFMGLSGIFIILIIALKRSRSLGYLGVALALAGGLLLTTRMFLLNMAESMEKPFHFKVEVLPVLLDSFLKMSMWITIGLFLIALLSIIINVLIGKKRAEKE